MKRSEIHILHTWPFENSKTETLKLKKKLIQKRGKYTSGQICKFRKEYSPCPVAVFSSN